MSCLTFPSRAERLALRNLLPAGETPPPDALPSRNGVVGQSFDAWREPAAGSLVFSRSTAPQLESVPELLPPAGDRAGIPCSGPPTEEAGGREETAPVLAAIAAERARHFEFGHDVAADVALLTTRPAALGDRAHRFVLRAQEDVQFRRGDWRSRAQRHVVQAAAMLLAFHQALGALPSEEIIDAA
jgi:hypothetical protein